MAGGVAKNFFICVPEAFHYKIKQKDVIYDMREMFVKKENGRKIIVAFELKIIHLCAKMSDTRGECLIYFSKHFGWLEDTFSGILNIRVSW